MSKNIFETLYSYTTNQTQLSLILLKRLFLVTQFKCSLCSFASHAVVGKKAAAETEHVETLYVNKRWNGGWVRGLSC